MYQDYDLRDWQFVADMTGDGAITVSDLSLWLQWLYFYPGDGLLYVLMRWLPGVSSFLELSFKNFGGILSGVVSAIFWFLLLAYATERRQGSNTNGAFP